MFDVAKAYGMALWVRARDEAKRTHVFMKKAAQGIGGSPSLGSACFDFQRMRSRLRLEKDAAPGAQRKTPVIVLIDG